MSYLIAAYAITALTLGVYLGLLHRERKRLAAADR
jgi:hypothetical protein